MRKSVLFLITSALLTLVFSGCNTIDTGGQYKDTSTKDLTSSLRYTVLVYMCGGPLEQNYGLATENLYSIVACDSFDILNIIVQTGGSLSWKYSGVSSAKAQRWRIYKNTASKVYEEDLKNMGDPDTLSDFIKWGISNYPAEKYLLVIWGNGGGWRGVCMDTAFKNDTLTLSELKSGLQAAYDATKIKFEMIAFDANNMSTLETASAVAPYAAYMAAFERDMPGNGLGYEELLTSLAENTAATGEELAKYIQEACLHQGTDSGPGRSSTLCVLKLDQIDGLVAAMEDLVDEMAKAGGLDNGFQIVRHAQKRYESGNIGGFSDPEAYGLDMVDIGRFVKNMDPYYPVAVKKVNKALKDAVLFNANSGDSINTAGISVYFPLTFEKKDIENIDKYYYKIPFSDKYKQFIKKYLSKAAALNYTFSFKNRNITDSDTTSVDINGKDIWLINNVFAVLLSRQADNKYCQIALNDSVKLDDVNDQLTAKKNLMWLTLKGNPLAAFPVDSNRMYTEYAAPVVINGLKGDLIFSRKANSSTIRMENYILWRDPETGMTPNRGNKLRPGDSVIPLYYKVDTSASKLYGLIQGKEFKVDDDINVELDSCNTMGYVLAFCVRDYAGRYYYTNHVKY